jgi:hypothetical protein
MTFVILAAFILAATILAALARREPAVPEHPDLPGLADVLTSPSASADGSACAGPAASSRCASPASRSWRPRR